MIHLLGRHPVLARSSEVGRFIRAHGVALWHERRAEGGAIQVVLRSADRRRLFAAVVSGHGPRERVERCAEFDLAAEIGESDMACVQRVARTRGSAAFQLQALRPVAELAGDEPALAWEVEVAEGGVIDAYRVERSAEVVHCLRRTPAAPAVPPKGPAPGGVHHGPDDLAENALHHVSHYRATAEAWTAGASSAEEKARRVFEAAGERLLYDLTIAHIEQFTWSDFLVIERLGWRGICDEWSVVQITMLRALGIPAALKFLTWTDAAGLPAAHACLEWSDQGRWRHMDALWGAFDDPAVYRQQGGARDVRVMDASHPLDSRSHAPAWGIADLADDLKLHPYEDYVIVPNYPGHARPGYSY